MMADEQAHDVANRLWDSPWDLVVGRLLYPETRAALAAAHRAKRISVHQLDGLIEQSKQLLEDVEVIEVHPAISDGAGELAQKHALAGCDAVHLASALSLGPSTTLATFDSRLATAAQNEGLGVATSLSS